MKGKAPSVLILTASYGSGHNRVAHALATGFRTAGAAPRVLDHFRDLVHPAFDRLTQSLYYVVLRHAPLIWGGAYWLGDQLPVHSPLLLGMNRLGARKLGVLLNASAPDLVVSVHPTPAGAFSELRASGLVRVPHATVFTDFVAHTQWIYPEVDWYCVPADEIKHDLVARGVPRERITVTGMPVAQEFAEPVDRITERRSLGLSSRIPVVLAMAGSHGGLGGLDEVCRALMEIAHPFQALVVTGTDGHLAERLRRLTRGHEGRIRVYPYVETIRKFMAAADLLVTKAGGVTLAEALAAELPLLCFGSLQGQELRNERFAGMTGVALVARSRAELKNNLILALTDPLLLRQLRERIRVIRRPGAARSVAELLLSGVSQLSERAS
jgi:processive 1,2-diacylglycerol beta-glucosyltransferase